MLGAVLAWIQRWWGRVAGRLEGSSDRSDGAHTHPDAQAVMAAMRAERADRADADAWRQAMATLKTRVFASPDRARLWRRTRRRYPGELIDLDLVTRPTRHDLDALREVLRQLERG